MSRKRTVSEAWQRLISAYGGDDNLRVAMGVAPARYQKIIRGTLKPDPTLANLIGMLAEKKQVPSPIISRLSPDDMRILEMTGQLISRGIFIRPKTMSALRKLPEDELVRLAEDDSTSPNIQLAVAHLLGLMDKA